MDTNVAVIADYAHALHYADLPASVVHQCKRSVVDTFGVALGAYHAQPSRIAREMAQRARVPNGARVIGIAHRTLPELAAFANGVMARYLDGNDAYPGGGGHPSDVIAAVLAVADVHGADGQAIITGIALAYEVYYNLWMATDVRSKGMDNVFYTAVGGAAGAAKVLGLDRTRTAEAISLAITPNVPLDATRYGHLSMWKGCAGGNAARNGVFAALLAAAGMTGPEKAIAGAHGLQNLAGTFTLSPFAGDGRPFRITEATQKRFLASGFSNAAITVAPEASQQVAVADIEKVTIHTAWFAWDASGREPEKWRPATREAADHSIPYVTAATLIDRAFSDDVFSEARLRDPRILALIDKIEVREDPELTRLGPLCLPCRIEVLTKSGELIMAKTDYPRGHYKNSMSDDEVSDKFRVLAQRALPQERISLALAALWQLDTASGVGAIFEAVQTDR